MLAGLVVDTVRMRANLAHSRGLIVAEAVMMGLAPALGRQASHDLVYDACRAAISEDIALAEALWRISEVRNVIGRDRLEKLCEPENYLGTAPLMVDRILAHRGPNTTEGNVDAA
jgi:3-carboxy-cis,cis-muconate cycloisomerase